MNTKACSSFRSLFFLLLFLCCCCCLTASVVSDSVQPYGLQPARLLCPWGFSRQEYWSGLPCPPPGDLPDPGTKPRSPALQADSLPLSHQGSPVVFIPFTKSLQRDYSSYSPMPLLWGIMGFQVAPVVKNPPSNAGDVRDASSIPGSGRSPGEGNGTLLPCSCLKNPMDRGTRWAIVYRVTMSRMQPKLT